MGFHLPVEGTLRWTFDQPYSNSYFHCSSIKYIVIKRVNGDMGERYNGVNDLGLKMDTYLSNGCVDWVNEDSLEQICQMWSKN